MKTIYVYLIVIIAIALLIVMVYPAFLNSNSNRPEWSKEASKFTFIVGIAIKQYSNEHNGHPPASLRELYPNYINDGRIKAHIAKFGGEALLIEYHKPQKLGDPKTIIMRMSLVKKDNTDQDNRPVILYGDLHSTRFE